MSVPELAPSAVEQINALQWSGKKLTILDQTALPEAEWYIECDTALGVAEAIRHLRVRGAPNIGVAAAYGFSMEFSRDPSLKRISKIVETLNVRPTAINLELALRLCQDAAFDAYEKGGANAAASAAAAVKMTAERFHQHERERSYAMAEALFPILQDKKVFITKCETGPLAAPGPGTALGAIIERHLRITPPVFVVVPETRPLMQGARLTAWELSRLGIEHVVISDSAIAAAIKEYGVEMALVGADRVVEDFSVANKIGTRVLAAVCKDMAVPFHVVAPSTTLDVSTVHGEDIPIEMRPQREVRSHSRIPLSSQIFNPAFDVTPPHLITGIWTEHGPRGP